MVDITHKHDKLARYLLTDIEIAKDFLQIHLPFDIKTKCDFNSLTIESGSFISEDLKSSQADVVYKINLFSVTSSSEPNYAYIYTLVEHQSSPEWLMPFRILQYQISIIQKHLDKHPKKNKHLPLVIPIVFYNGDSSPYPYSNNISEIFANKNLYQKIQLGNFTLVDLTVLEDNEILRHKKAAALEATLKHIRTRNFVVQIEAIIKALEIACKAGLKKESISVTFKYLIDAKEKDEVLLFFDKIESSKLNKYGDEIMTYADYLRQEGEQKGEHNAQQKIAMEFLRDGDSVERVARCTHLSIDEVQDLLQNIKNK